MASRYKYIQDLVKHGGDITVGCAGGLDMATASDGHNCLVMLGIDKDEKLVQILQRLESAVKLAVKDGIYTDEING